MSRHDDSKVPVSTFVMEVWGKDCEIRVRQKSKSVWVAHGEYMGEQFSSTGSSARSAASHWRDAARYKGNDGPAPQPERPQESAPLPQTQSTKPTSVADRDEIVSGDIRISFRKTEK
jgi:hypothetical protein